MTGKLSHYNTAVSNENRRLAQHKAFPIALSGLFFLTLFLFMMTSHRVDAQMAQISEGEHRYKYYTSITVQDGDTLWDLSDLYLSDEYSDRNEYMTEVLRLNHMTRDCVLHSGSSIIIPYYSSSLNIDQEYHILQ